MIKFCYICYSKTDDDYICDRCDEHYCYDCSYTFSLHYQHQGSRCYYCADQSRRDQLTKEDKRNNLLVLWEEMKKKY